MASLLRASRVGPCPRRPAEPWPAPSLCPAAALQLVFALVSMGAIVLTVNVVLLGGTIGFFQSLCLLGYCLFPMDVAAIVCVTVKIMLVRCGPCRAGLVGRVLRAATRGEGYERCCWLVPGAAQCGVGGLSRYGHLELRLGCFPCAEAAVGQGMRLMGLLAAPCPPALQVDCGARDDCVGVLGQHTLCGRRRASQPAGAGRLPAGAALHRGWLACAHHLAPRRTCREVPGWRSSLLLFDCFATSFVLLACELARCSPPPRFSCFFLSRSPPFFLAFCCTLTPFLCCKLFPRSAEAFVLGMLTCNVGGGRLDRQGHRHNATLVQLHASTNWVPARQSPSPF